MKMIRLGTLFSGIGAFEHALKQLNIEYEIKFACDCGERELPMKYGDLFHLIAGMTRDEIINYCTDYINKVGVKVEYRQVEIDLMKKILLGTDIKYNSDAPIVLKYNKDGRKSLVEHKLILTQEQIIQLTDGMSMKEREVYVNKRYNNMGEHNYVKDAYFANYDITEEQWHEDIRFLDAKEFNNGIDILVGGSPCQSFSTYGKKLGLEDVRGTLFYDYARIIKESNPKIFIYENVAAIKSNDYGHTWETMLSVWKSLGYEIYPEILNAVDYDHPQLRRRVFIVGIREDICTTPYKFPEKKKRTKKSTDFLEKGPIPLKYYLGEGGFTWITTYEKHKRRSRVNQEVIGCQTANQQDNWIGDFRVEHPLSAHYKDPRIFIGKFDFKDGKGMVDAVARKLTPRECLRLMGFSDKFRIVVDDHQAYHQSGNSIVVPVLKEIIQTIIPYLK